MGDRETRVSFGLLKKNTLTAEKTVLIAILSASASAGRIIFASLPNIQGASFIIILSGAVFGSGIGFMTGVLTAVISNMFLGHGPWTIWQMLCWGMMGYTSGLFSSLLKKSSIIRLIFGFLWGYIFGWITNIWIILSYGYTEAGIIMGVYAASFVFDTLHGLSNAVLLFLFGNKFIKIFDRVSIKYGID